MAAISAIPRRISGCLLISLVSCTAAPRPTPPVSLGEARTPAELAALLESIAARTDAEACAGRGRIYARLRELDGAGAPILRAKGDAADLDVMAQPADADLKAESAGRLARHFLERARGGARAGSPFQGAFGGPLRRFVLLTVAAYFGEYASREIHAEALDGLADLADEFSSMEDLKEEFRKDWHRRAKFYGLRADDLRAAEERGEIAPEARKFCEADLGRHLGEATRSADLGTSEKAARGDPGRALECYLTALAHYVLARECLTSPSPAEEHALSGMEIVVRSVCELIGANP